MLVKRLLRLRDELAAAVVASIFHPPLVLEPLPGKSGLSLAHLADPAAELVGVEMRVTAVDRRGEDAVLKVEQRGVSAFGRARGIPGARRGAHARHGRAGQQAQD